MRRRLGVLGLGLVLATVSGACGDSDADDDEEVRAAIERTARLSRGLVYTEEHLDTELRVEAVIDDDLRYRARLSIDGRPVYDEVVFDDTVAARILDDAALDVYREPTLALPGEASAESDGAEAGTDPLDPLDALQSRRWVVDPVGAPSVVSPGADERRIGDDPIFDALTVLRYIDTVVLRENAIVEFNEFDLEYDPQEDPFPKPSGGSEVVRYDVRPPRLPRASDAAGNQAVPGPQHFRKMAVYVRDGVVIRVLETFDVASRLDEMEEIYDIEFEADQSTDERVRIAIEAVNAVRRGQGTRPIRIRSMSLDLVDLGQDHTVGLPTDGVVEARLDVLRFRGSDDLRPEG